jgi:hypothetical protein
MHRNAKFILGHYDSVESRLNLKSRPPRLPQETKAFRGDNLLPTLQSLVDK